MFVFFLSTREDVLKTQKKLNDFFFSRSSEKKNTFFFFFAFGRDQLDVSLGIFTIYFPFLLLLYTFDFLKNLSFFIFSLYFSVAVLIFIYVLEVFCRQQLMRWLLNLSRSVSVSLLHEVTSGRSTWGHSSTFFCRRST